MNISKSYIFQGESKGKPCSICEDLCNAGIPIKIWKKFRSDEKIFEKNQEKSVGVAQKILSELYNLMKKDFEREI